MLSQIFATFGPMILLCGLAQFFWKPDHRLIPHSLVGGNIVLGPVQFGLPQFVAALENVMVGLNALDGGSVLLKGRDIASVPAHERVKRGLGGFTTGDTAKREETLQFADNTFTVLGEPSWGVAPKLVTRIVETVPTYRSILVQGAAT